MSRLAQACPRLLTVANGVLAAVACYAVRAHGAKAAGLTVGSAAATTVYLVARNAGAP